MGGFMLDYLGECSCGLIKFSCKGDPLFTQYCHCNKCRDISSLSNRDSDKSGYAFTAAYLTQNFRITSGNHNLEEIIANNVNHLRCKSCHSLIYGISRDPEKQAGIGVNANNFKFSYATPDAFKPVRHIWYTNRIIDFNDDLPKYIDAPKEQLGTGELFTVSPKLGNVL